MGTTNLVTEKDRKYNMIRRMVRSMTNHHWSVLETLDEYDIPESERAMYIETIGNEFIVT